MQNSSPRHQVLLGKLGEAIYVLTKDMKARQVGEAVCTTPALDQVLLITGKQAGANVKQLAAFLQTTSGAVTQHIDALEQLGAVKRLVNDKDRREVRIELTDSGHQLYHNIVKQRLGLFTDVFAALDETELQTLLDLIVKVSDTRDKRKTGASV